MLPMAGLMLGPGRTVLVCKPAGHDGDHRPGDHSLMVIGEPLVVADRAAVPADPGKVRSTSHRRGSTWNAWASCLRTILTRRPKAPPPGPPACPRRRHQPTQPDATLRDPQSPQQRPGAVAVLHAGGGDQHHQQKPQGVHGDVALAAVDLLAGVEPAAGFGDRAGRADRLGVDDRRREAGLRPACRRTCSRSASWTRPRVPSAAQRAKNPYTVRHGGKSAGSARHTQPLWTR
jgi:hypothetical protein